MLTAKDIQKIASLSKLALTPAESEKMTKELGNILHFVEKLEELKLEGVEATSHAVEMTNVFREDRAAASPVKEAALKAAPETEGNFFKVPKII
ncbi:MAG: Asp-tRNA(Asn)/Glu-tRNA(Gln) amidotransferase subunit GatC [Deltaproteobacteria bacterium]|nr:Asp-tRNA(Asn)/Glu-tRNA(Gln) amidotransferase subunit GatC [Deltaproteobacteria bacterium]